MSSYRTMLSGIAAFALVLSSVLVAMPVAAATTGDIEAPHQRIDNSRSAVYIVQMIDAPVAAYTGGVPGLRATAPARGHKINSLDNDVVRYVDHLSRRQNDKVARVGAQKIYGYTYSFSGFAARLTARQAADLRADPEVVQVEKTQEVMMDTATTPEFLGLKDPEGLWTLGYKGENVIIGILDSGIWPESASFSDRTGSSPNNKKGKLDYQQIPGFHGKCVEAEAWDGSMCNQKLIAAQYYCAARSCETGVLPHEFVSPRDYNGHGTHVASTAGGNENTATTQGASLFRAVSGVAPRARIAAYKIGWDNGEGGAGANTGDVVAAIDQAISDGVDVLNYSFSGTRTAYTDSVEIAFLFAAQAGVFVATSAGNSGPTASTVAHISPWLASVAAGTHDRSGSATITLGNAATYTGASLTDAASGSVVLASESGLAGKHADLVRQCFSAASTSDGDPVLDSAKITGKIVVCERGGPTPVAANARVDKSVAVREAGGIGMILVNVTANSINADLHSLPTVHVNNVDGAAITAYVNSTGATATASLSRGVVNRTAPAPDVAAFSSRGPSIAGAGDILKPDFMAPGQDILAAVAPPGNAGKDFDIYSGTSMSSPHVAGLGALLTQIHPDWSPAAMRSALATTADATSRAPLRNPFGAGSGHVRPNLATNPGLVYEAGFDDYRGFLRGQGLCTLCFGTAAAATINASNLNQPSIAVGSLAGVQTVTRRVTNVGAAATYTAAITAPTGFTVTVSPMSLTLAAGETGSYSLTITRTTAAFGTYAFGSITWTDASHSVRSPIVVRPVPIAAPAETSGTGANGSRTFAIKAGYSGSLNYGKQGLIPSTTTSGSVADDPSDSFAPAASAFVKAHDFNVASGTTILRLSMFDAETDGADDLDLFLYRINADDTLTAVASSGGGTSAEQITLTNPPPANYRLFVHGFDTEGPDANYTFHTWKLGTTDAGNLSVAGPNAVTTGETGDVTISWTGLTAGQRYLGRVLYQEGTTIHGSTIIRIDVP